MTGSEAFSPIRPDQLSLLQRTGADGWEALPTNNNGRQSGGVMRLIRRAWCGHLNRLLASPHRERHRSTGAAAAASPRERESGGRERFVAEPAVRRAPACVRGCSTKPPPPPAGCRRSRIVVQSRVSVSVTAGVRAEPCGAETSSLICEREVWNGANVPRGSGGSGANGRESRVIGVM